MHLSARYSHAFNEGALKNVADQCQSFVVLTNFSASNLISSSVVIGCSVTDACVQQVSSNGTYPLNATRTLK